MPSSSAHWVTGRTTSASSGGLARHEVADHEQVEGGEPRRATAVGVRGADHQVGAVHEQRARTSACRASASSSMAGMPLPGRASGSTPHTAGDVRARRRVLDRSVAGELVGLLAVLAAALAVALAGDRAVAAADPPGQPERQREVDRGGDGVGALRALLDATPGEDEGAPPPRAGLASASSRAASRRVGRAPRTPARRAPATRRPTDGARPPGRSVRSARYAASASCPRRARRAGGRAARRGRCRAPAGGAGPAPPSVSPAVALRRGSTTTSPPRARGAGEVLRRRAASSRRGCCPAAARPVRRRGRSSGNGSPRSMPSVRLAAAAALTPCRTGRCSRCSRCRSATRANLPSW